MDKHLNNEIIARKFTIGQILDIEVRDTVRHRFQTRLIGMKEGRYLVSELPSMTRHGNLRDKLMNQQELIVRTICEKTTGECLGFKSYVSAKIKMPEQLLFMTFPMDVQVHELRRERRMLITQPAILEASEPQVTISGVLADFSGGGCRFEFTDIGHAPFSRDAIVSVSFQHPESGEDVIYQSRICSVRNLQNLVSLGLAFSKE